MLHDNVYSSEKLAVSRLLTAREVAKILNIGLSTTYLLIQSGELPIVRIGRSVRVRPEDLEAFIDLRLEF